MEKGGEDHMGVHVKTENVLHRTNEQMNALSTTKRRKANCITTYCIEDGRTRKKT